MATSLEHKQAKGVYPAGRPGNVEVRTVAEADWPQVATLLRIVFGRPFDVSFLRAKYTSYYGQRCTARPGMSFCKAAWRGGRLLAFVGALPCRVQKHDQEYDALQVCEFASHPDARRGGLNHRLLDAIRDVAVEDGFSLLFVMATDQSVPSIRAYAFEIVHTMRYHTLRAGMLPLLAPLAKLPLVGPQILQRAMRALPLCAKGSDAWQNPYVSLGFLGVQHSLEYLRCKSASNVRLLQIGESLVWVKVSTALHVGAMSVQDVSSLDEVVGALSGFARRVGIARIHWQSVPGDQLTDALDALGASGRSFVVGVLPLVDGLEADDLRLHYLDFDTY